MAPRSSTYRPRSFQRSFFAPPIFSPKSSCCKFSAKHYHLQSVQKFTAPAWNGFSLIDEVSGGSPRAGPFPCVPGRQPRPNPPGQQQIPGSSHTTSLPGPPQWGVSFPGRKGEVGKPALHHKGASAGPSQRYAVHVCIGVLCRLHIADVQKFLQILGHVGKRLLFPPAEHAGIVVLPFCDLLRPVAEPQLFKASFSQSSIECHFSRLTVSMRPFGRYMSTP